MTKIEESSVQKHSFIDNTELPAETPFPRKKTSNNKGGPKFDERDNLIENKINYTRNPSQNLAIQTPLLQTKITQHFNLNAPLSSKVNDRID
ncbi:unnamed protein product [Rhizophagus irregularis]|nr:unnamed protein product [Rhizophagus irregularis]